MYDECEYCVKTGEGLTQCFDSASGVKQGFNLSPTLANVFQNDLHSIFDNNCDPVQLSDLSLNSMSWADDLVRHPHWDYKDVWINCRPIVINGDCM